MMILFQFVERAKQMGTKLFSQFRFMIAMCVTVTHCAFGCAL